MRLFLWVSVWVVVSSAANAAAPSQIRPRDVPWQKMAQLHDALTDGSQGQGLGTSVRNAAAPYESIPLDEIPAWRGARSELLKEFKRVRDLRFLALPEMKSFLRRIPWLYPDDGCYVRAERMNHELTNGPFPTPMKLFAFGNLALKTENSPSDWVFWWYHVAPVIYVEDPSDEADDSRARSSDHVYVLDPAMNPHHPIRLKTWVKSMAGEVGQARLALCDPTAYKPSSPCRGASVSTLREAQDDTSRLLRKEWHRLEDLARNPRAELGDEPPW